MFVEANHSLEKAILVHLSEIERDTNQEYIEEFYELIKSCQLEVVDFFNVKIRAINPRLFLGVGKVEEISQAVKDHHADVVIVNGQLSPAQERNLEKALQCKVIDRVGLILDIFAQRARTSEGKLQVELAQLQYMSTRLIRGWTHLERQKGGIGLRGPGETQLETDRRLLRNRMKTITDKLAKLEQQRGLGRSTRKKRQLLSVAIVGYTNAGKSTLFNTLTKGEVYAADQLFATLDPTLKKLQLNNMHHVILSDTVGFIRHLPHDLIEAFHATLEEVRQADLLLHVIDATHQEHLDTITQVESVLTELQADQIPRIKVFNKIDLLENEQPRIQYDAQGFPIKVWLSAVTGMGVPLLKEAIEQALKNDTVRQSVHLLPSQGEVHARLHDLKVIESETMLDNGDFAIEICAPKVLMNQLKKEFSHIKWNEGS